LFEILSLKKVLTNKFVNWVMACLSTASYTFNANGDLARSFVVKKGLR